MIASSVYGGFSLKPDNSLDSNGNSDLKKATKFGSIPKHAVIKDEQQYTWKIYVEKPAVFTADLSYSFQGKPDEDVVRFSIGEMMINHNVKFTGKTIGEPSSNWVIDNFSSEKMGMIKLEEPGYYEVKAEFKPKKGHEIKFNWIWIEKNIK